jgi:GntR family transcriptional regulator
MIDIDQIRSLDHASVPLKFEVSARLIDLIEGATFQPGSKLPSEQQLATAFGVSRMTIRDSLALLELQGFLLRRHGVGTFVRGPLLVLNNPMEVNLGVSEAIRRNGMEPGVTNLEIRREHPSSSVARKLDLSGDIYIVERTRTCNSFPLAFTIDHMPANLVADEARLREYSQGSLYEFLEKETKIEIDYGISALIPELADARLAKNLQVPNGCPIVLMEQLDYSIDGKPVLLSYEYYIRRGIRFSVLRSRKNPPKRPGYVSASTFSRAGVE